MPALNLVEDADAGDANAVVRIEIADGELCPVYRARALSGVTIAKRPDWLRYRLIAIGQRPISNIVDVTNYILMELGQPLHAFDRGLLKGGVVRVAPAQDGMSITTLDGQERKLLGSDLLILGRRAARALAGRHGRREFQRVRRHQRSAARMRHLPARHHPQDRAQARPAKRGVLPASSAAWTRWPACSPWSAPPSSWPRSPARASCAASPWPSPSPGSRGNTPSASTAATRFWAWS